MNMKNHQFCKNTDLECDFNADDRKSGILHNLDCIEILDSYCFFNSNTHTSERKRHYHNCIEIMYVVHGSATHYIKHPDGHEETAIISEGDYIILDFHTYHSYANGSPDFSIINFLFKPPLIRRYSEPKTSFMSIICAPPFNFSESSFHLSPSNTILHDEDQTIYLILKKAQIIYQTQKYGYLELLHGYVIEIIFLSIHPLITSLPIVKENKIISQIQDYVAVHYSEPISLTQICHGIFFSMPYISKKFKEICGISFERYLQEVRVRKACILLIDTNHCINDIAIMVGYNDPSSFRKVFFKITGVKPFDFRKQHNPL